MDFIRANLGATQAEERRIETLEQEVIGYKKEVYELKSQLEAVKVKLIEYEKGTDAKDADGKDTDETANEVKPTGESVQVTESKPDENVSGAEVDAVKDKTVAESEKAATPNSTTTSVDSAKAVNDSESAAVAISNTTIVKSDDDEIKSTSTTDEADKTKTSENAATAIVTATENEK